MRLLFVTARFPYPPLKGDQVRAYHQLRLLGPKHRITLLSFADGTVTPEDRAHLAQFCERIVTVPLSRIQMMGALLCGLASSLPFQTLLYRTSRMRAAVRDQLATGGFDLVHLQLARMAPHLEGAVVPRVVDLVDALSLNMKRRAAEEHGAKKALLNLEARRMSRYERQICRTFEQVTVVSPVDKQEIGEFPNLHINSNGVDLDDFAFSREGRVPDTLVFSGNMGYFPNVNAVTWFAREVLPLVKSEIPSVRFEIVGTNPGREVRELAEADTAISVTGYVEDLRAYLARSCVGVVPMRAGSGIQNKVIEAMACGSPLVATPYALGGIAAQHEKHLLIAHDAAEFAAHTVRLLRDATLRDNLAQAARFLVEQEYTWEKFVSSLEEIYTAAMASSRSSTATA